MGQRTDAYWLYVLHRAQDLRALGVKIICVFDGKSTKLKQETGAKRRAARRTSTDAGIRLREQAQSTSNPVAKERLEKEAHDYFRRVCVLIRICPCVYLSEI
jgi:5'-3' exonuclease